MARDIVLRVRYVGVFPQAGHHEYRFLIENEAGEIRDVSLTIDDDLFGGNRLMFQEAPDLCYQKLLLDVHNESRDAPIFNRAAIAAADINSYRESHPTARARKTGGVRQA